MSEQSDILDVNDANQDSIMMSAIKILFMITIAGTSAGALNHAPDVIKPYLQDNHIGVLSYAEFCTVLATIFVCINLTKWLISAIKWIRDNLKTLKSYIQSKKKKKNFDSENIQVMGGNGGSGPGEEEIEKDE